MSKRKLPDDADDAPSSAAAAAGAAAAPYDGVKKARTVAGPAKEDDATTVVRGATAAATPGGDAAAAAGPTAPGAAAAAAAGAGANGDAKLVFPLAGTPQTALVRVEDKQQLIVHKDAKNSFVRTSSLLAPTMRLTGHGGPVLTARFNPAGTYVASASQDKLVLLWKVYGECNNFATLKGHQNSILGMTWSRDGDQLYTVSADKTGTAWDVESGTSVRRFREHTSFVNAVAASRKGDALVITGADDCKALVYDVRYKKAAQTLETEFQVLSVEFSEDTTRVFTAGIDHNVKVWDRRAGRVLYTLDAHNDSITAIALSPDGNHLLSNGMDNTLRIWDVRPYVSAAPGGGAAAAAAARLVHTFEGNRHDLQKNLLKCAWSADGARVSCGSADRLVHIWDVASKRLLYRLPGHGGCVNDVHFHPNEPIIVSCSDDKTLFLGEINP